MCDVAAVVNRECLFRRNAFIHRLSMFTLPFVETMITQVCNLSCRGCSNYSDLKHKGYVPWQQGRQWFESWQQRMHFDDIGIMGGEPFINPEWRDWLYGTRQLWPNSQIRFTTNGLLLFKQPDIMPILQDIGNIVFKITVHVENAELENWIHEFLARHDWRSVTEFGIDRWQLPNRIRFQLNRPDKFVQPFQNDYANMMPWKSDPQKAFANCVQQTCPLLYKGRIYKCSTSALLKDTLNRFGNPNLDAWVPFITDGVSPDSDQNELQQFVARFGQAERICAQCPDNTVAALDHRLLVTVKNQYR